MKKHKRVVVTGVNACCSLGMDIGSVWESFAQGRSNIGPIRNIDAQKMNTRIGGEMPPEFYELHKAKANKNSTINSFLSETCAQPLFESTESAGSFYSSIGIVLGSGLGGLYFSEQGLAKIYGQNNNRVHPLSVPNVDPNGVVSAVSRRWNVTGYQFAVSTACSSSANAIGIAADLIRSGRLDCVLTGGAEHTFSPLVYAGFDQLRAMSRNNSEPAVACSPFSVNRDGFVMGEGAAMLMLESEESALKRNAEILAEVAGYGATGGAYHVVKPVESGADGLEAMRLAIDDAAINHSDINVISPHGTGTVLNDSAEYLSLKGLFGERLGAIPSMPIKQLTGHMLGASGAMEAVHLVKCIQNQVITPIKQYTPEPGQNLNIETDKVRSHNIQYAISNSFGFGNNNVSLVFKKYI